MKCLPASCIAISASEYTKMSYMNRLVLFATFLVVATFFFATSVGELPERVATHFAMKGVADVGRAGRNIVCLCS